METRKLAIVIISVLLLSYLVWFPERIAFTYNTLITVIVRLSFVAFALTIMVIGLFHAYSAVTGKNTKWTIDPDPRSRHARVSGICLSVFFLAMGGVGLAILFGY